MSAYCVFCDTHRPKTGTDILVLGVDAKAEWLEFCEPCGEKEILKNEKTGEEVSVRELFDRTSDKEVADA